MTANGIVMRLLVVFAGVVALSTAKGGEDQDRWARMLESVSSGVVSIRVDATRAFDTEWNSSSQATGFVVDAERGIVLTNRHVVAPGPVVAEAVFRNHEEVELQPIYRDPVHDFGFFRYDPSELEYLEPAEIELAPEAAEVGREVRVVGNDAGEQLSILAGTIARLDRKAPDYGRGRYNDFNTFYYQAASGTSGGSSGSPVLDVEGRAVALNAGSRRDASSSYFLPLDRVVRALERLRTGEPVTRGTLRTTFVRRPYEELARLGLGDGIERRMRERFPDQTGLLVVDQVLAGSPAKSLLEPGDILLSLDGQPVARFGPLEQVLDSRVGETIAVTVARDGEEVTVELSVEDLHAITPASYLEIGGGVFNRLSYQMARHLNRPPEGVWAANPGFMLSTAGVPRGAIITRVNGKPVSDLDDFQAVLESIADGERFRLRYVTFSEPRREEIAIGIMERRWFPARRCTRDDRTGHWPCEMLPDAPPDGELEPRTARFPDYRDPRAARIAHSLAFVSFDMPYRIAGIETTHYYGTGLVVDAERGLVVVDRNTVPEAMGDVRLTFAGSVEIPGRVEFIHPTHNLAVVSYDPALLGDTDIRSAELSREPMEPGNPYWVVGHQPDQSLVSQATEVASIDPIRLPLSNSFRFRETNLEVANLVNPPDNVSGVIADKDGAILGLWASFAYQGGRNVNQKTRGISADLVRQLLETVRSEDARRIRSLEAELRFMPLASARKLGLPESWAARIEKHDDRRRRVLSVVRQVAGSPAAEALEEGDLLLAIDGRVVTDFRSVERATRAERVEVTLFREGELIERELGTVALDGRGVDRVLLWAGAVLHEPHRALAAQRGLPRDGVFMAYYNYGSPASRYELQPGRRIVAVDRQPVHGLDDFLEIVAGKSDGDSVRLKALMWDGSVEVITLELDLRYWPTYELRYRDGAWHRRMID